MHTDKVGASFLEALNLSPLSHDSLPVGSLALTLLRNDPRNAGLIVEILRHVGPIAEWRIDDGYVCAASTVSRCLPRSPMLPTTRSRTPMPANNTSPFRTDAICNHWIKAIRCPAVSGSCAGLQRLRPQVQSQRVTGPGLENLAYMVW